jgi:hypothetical protein
MNNEQRDLLKYYTSVSKCQLCKEYYGVNIKEAEANKETCPDCEYKMIGKRSRWRKHD